MDIYKSDRILKIRLVSFVRPFTSTATTFVFVALGWYFFMTPTQEIHDVAKNEIAFLNSDYNSPDERFELSQGYWKKYGYGINIALSYPEDRILDVEYKKLGDEEWVILENKISTNKSSTQIHGEEKYGGDRRNLEPGLYVVRLKESHETNWFGGIIQIENYRDE